jgi:hypothetical protein
MAVKSHGGDAHVGGGASHGQRGQSPGVGDPDRRIDDSLPGEARPGLPGAAKSRGVCAGCVHHGADTRERAHQALLTECRQHLGGRGHRNAELPDELPRRRHPVTRPERAGGDPLPDLRGDAAVGRNRFRIGPDHGELLPRRAAAVRAFLSELR